MFSSVCPSRSTGTPYRPRVESLEDRVVLSHVPIGPEFQANQESLDPFAASFGADVAIAADQTGQFVVVWTDIDQSNEAMEFDVKAQVFDRDGNALFTDDILVADNVPAIPPDFFSGQFFSEPVNIDVAMTPDGGFVVVYDVGVLSEVDGAEVRAVFFPNFFAAYQGVPTPAPSAPDSVLIAAFGSPDQTDPGFDRAFDPAVAINANGITFVSFTTRLNGSFGFDSERIRVQVLNANGQLIGSPIVVSDTDSFPSSRSSIAADDSGDFVVAWITEAGGVVYRLFSSRPGANTAITVLEETSPSATVSVGKSPDTGSFVVAWDGDGTIRARRFDALGNPLDNAPFQVNEGSDFTLFPHVSSSLGGNFVISWSRSSGASTILVRAFSADGAPETPQYEVNEFTMDFGLNDVATSRDFSQFIVTYYASPDFGESENSEMEFQPVVQARIYRVPAGPGDPGIPLIPDDTATLIALVNAQPRPPVGGDPFIFPDFPAPFDPDVFLSPQTISPPPPVIRITGSAEERRIEALGEISGIVFSDVNGNGIMDENEVGVFRHRVFLDLNGDGVEDPDEPSMLTDSEGRYNFSGLALKRYHVRQNLRAPRIIQTAPERNRGYDVELTAENSSVTGKDFGLKVLPAGASATGRPLETPSTPPDTPEKPSGPQEESSPPRE